MELLILIIKAIARAMNGSDAVDPAMQRRRAEWERQQQAYWASQLQQVGQLPPTASSGLPPLPVPVRKKHSAAPPPRGQPQAAPQRAVQVAPPQQAARPVMATAPAIHRWMQPTTLRSQFILTEILKPPLALRPPRQ